MPAATSGSCGARSSARTRRCRTPPRRRPRPIAADVEQEPDLARVVLDLVLRLIRQDRLVTAATAVAASPVSGPCLHRSGDRSLAGVGRCADDPAQRRGRSVSRFSGVGTARCPQERAQHARDPRSPTALVRVVWASQRVARGMGRADGRERPSDHDRAVFQHEATSGAVYCPVSGGALLCGHASDIGHIPDPLVGKKSWDVAALRRLSRRQSFAVAGV